MSCNSEFYAPINHHLVRETPSYNFHSLPVSVNEAKARSLIKRAMCLDCQLNLTTSKTECISSDRGSFYAVLVHRYRCRYR